MEAAPAEGKENWRERLTCSHSQILQAGLSSSRLIEYVSLSVLAASLTQFHAIAQVLADKLKLIAAKRASKLRLAARGRFVAHPSSVKTGLLQITPSLLMTEVLSAAPPSPTPRAARLPYGAARLPPPLIS